MLTDQWFLDLTSDTRVDGKPGPGGRKAITEPALNAVRSGDIKFVPENWSDHVQPVAREHPGLVRQPPALVGPPIPAWYDEAGNIFVGEDEADARRACRRPNRSARCVRTRTCSTPGSRRRCGRSRRSAGPATRRRAPPNGSDYNVFLPSTVLVTGFDIIFFWVARMVMATQYFTRQRAVPRGLHQRDRARRRRPEDVQVQGQHDRSARSDRRHRRSNRW